MYDWNQNGKIDFSDRYVDYKGSQSHHSGSSSGWWIWLLLAALVVAFPPLGIIFVIVVCILEK